MVVEVGKQSSFLGYGAHSQGVHGAGWQQPQGRHYSSFRDPYSVLGVGKDAGVGEIKRAYFDVLSMASACTPWTSSIL